MRVHELAKEMDKTNKEVLDVLKEKNIEVKSHMSSLSNEEIDVVKKSFAENTEKEEPKKKHIVQVFRRGKWVERILEIVMENQEETAKEDRISRENLLSTKKRQIETKDRFRITIR